MGCVCSKQVKQQRERTICVANHMVALTSTTLGVLELERRDRERDHVAEKEKQCSAGEGRKDQNCWVEKTVIEEEKKAVELDPDPVTINAWELMEGLDDDVAHSPAITKSIEEDTKNEISSLHTKEEVQKKKISSFHTIEEIDDAKKENATPVGGCGNGNNDTLFLSSGKKKMKEVSSPLHELKVNSLDCYKSSRPLKTPENFSRRASDGSMTDLKVAPTRRLNSRFRLSIDLITEPDSPLFSPGLVASLEKALENLSEEEWNAIKKAEEEGGVRGGSFSAKVVNQKKKKKKVEEPLENFERKCPPGGGNAVVLYTTTLRGIRKTFEECNMVRDALESYGICMRERDVSMHLEFRNELRLLMGKLVTVPRVFIKGRYIGGADELLRIHEEGKLGELLQGIPTQVAGQVCDGCGGVRFVPCLECSGSCKLVNEHNMVVRCPECNENGLIQCPICS